MLRDQTDAIGVAVGKAGAYGGGASAFFFGLTANEFAAVSGVVVAVIGLAVQWFYNRRRDRRESAEFDARMRRYRQDGKASVSAVGATGLVLASAALMGFIGKWESGSERVLTVYADKLAGGLPTVCHGLTRHVTTTPIIVGERWTNEKCEAEERAAMVRHVQIPLRQCLRHDPPQSVFDALSSHGWNFGVARTCGSVAAQYVRRGDYKRACERIAHDVDGRPVWSYAGGKFLRGLFNRRLDERKLCLRDVK